MDWREFVFIFLLAFLTLHISILICKLFGVERGVILIVSIMLALSVILFGLIVTLLEKCQTIIK